MRLDDCYALLDLRPGATDDEMKRAHRDLAKVWHPDRFANDAALRRKAEEKLKAINEAYETILASRAGASSGHSRAADDPRAETDAARSASLRHQHVVRNRTWALTCLAAAVFVLVRRPTAGGLLIALLLFCAAFAFFMRMRAGQAAGRP